MIQLANVIKQYGDGVVLNGITTTFNEGHIYGLVGANGCGKTTLMRCICGFSRHNQGTVVVDGKRIGKDRDFPGSTGIIIENPSFLPQYSGFKNLMILAGISHKANREIVCATMRKLGLDPESRKEVSKYSLGMRQRLGIAQAIMENPKILILDEPFNGLDMQGIEDIHLLLQKLKRENKLIILASHSAVDIGLACDVIYDIEGGKLISRNGI